MALLESCCGCSLAVTSAVLGVYLLVAYIIAFVIELWWILESPVALPIPAYILCLMYFILLTFSALLLHGLSVRRTTFLLVWLFMLGLLLGPEAGLVLYLSIQYWRVTSMYGLIEITCWGCRLLVNAIGLLCVQSLHSIWREEKSVLMRLETLKAQSPVPKVHQSLRGRRLSVPMQGYNNHGYDQTDTSTNIQKEKPDIDSSYNQFTHPTNGGVFKSEDYTIPALPYVDTYYDDRNAISEFNASSFDPTVIDARLEKMPYLTVRKKPKEINELMDEGEEVVEEKIVPKTRSLMDIREWDFNNLDVQPSNKPKPVSMNHNNLLEKPVNNVTKPKNNFGSLDRNIIKNKNLKILKTLSPFGRKKDIDEMNIYRINPPMDGKVGTKDLNLSKLDSQLNKVYGNRGMYMFDEKSRKVVFYPPEMFNDSRAFRKRMDSYVSSQSRSSMDTNDSEDIRHISDVAL